MYRQRHFVKGRRVARGSFKIDLLTPFPSCRRIAKATGIKPDAPSAKERVAEFKLMVRDLIAIRDEDTLRKIYKGELTLSVVHRYWKQGRTPQAESGLHKNLLQQLDQYISTSALAASTKHVVAAAVKTLEAKGLLTSEHNVSDLVEVLSSSRDHYRSAKAYDGYNNVRFFFLGFVRNHLKLSRSSHLYRNLVELEPLIVRARKPHHPFVTLRDLQDFVSLLLSRETLDESSRRRYAQAVIMMCFHGFRPSEFCDGTWHRDKHTGHLRIAGTKTPQSNRVVPCVYYFKGYMKNPIKVDTLNHLLASLGTQVRVRDFRRTYSVWCELAGIQRHRLQRYMGHVGSSMTDIYQRTEPSTDALNEDRDKLLQWFAHERAKPRTTKKSPYADSTAKMLDDFFPVVEP